MFFGELFFDGGSLGLITETVHGKDLAGGTDAIVVPDQDAGWPIWTDCPGHDPAAVPHLFY